MKLLLNRLELEVFSFCLSYAYLVFASAKRHYEEQASRQVGGLVTHASPAMSDNLDAQIRAEQEARRRGGVALGAASSLDDELFGGAGGGAEFANEVVEGGGDDAFGGRPDDKRTGSRVGSDALRATAAHSSALEAQSGDGDALRRFQAAGGRFDHSRVGDRETDVRTHHEWLGRRARCWYVCSRQHNRM